MTITNNLFVNRVERVRFLANNQRGNDPLELKEIYERVADMGEFALHNISIGQDVQGDIFRIVCSLDVFGGSRRDVEGLWRKREIISVLIEQEEFYLRELYGYKKEEQIDGPVASVEDTPREENRRELKSFKDEYQNLINTIEFLPLEYVMNKADLEAHGFTDEMRDAYFHVLDRAKSGKEEIAAYLMSDEVREENMDSFTRYAHNLGVLLYNTSCMLRTKNSADLQKAYGNLQNVLENMAKYDAQNAKNIGR